MKQETLVLLPNFIGDAIYEGFEAAKNVWAEKLIEVK